MADTEKLVEQLSNLSVLEIAGLVKQLEGAPKTIKEGVTKQEADEMKKKIEAAGAKVEIK